MMHSRFATCVLAILASGKAVSAVPVSGYSYSYGDNNDNSNVNSLVQSQGPTDFGDIKALGNWDIPYYPVRSPPPQLFCPFCNSFFSL